MIYIYECVCVCVCVCLGSRFSYWHIFIKDNRQGFRVEFFYYTFHLHVHWRDVTTVNEDCLVIIGNL